MTGKLLLACLLIGISVPVYGAESTMPRELVETAKASGCEPIPGFYDNSYIVDPPYLYGYVPGEGLDVGGLTRGWHVVFWCQGPAGSGTGVQLLFLSKGVYDERFSLAGERKKQTACPPVVAWGPSRGKPPGGLSVGDQTGETLNTFFYMDGDGRKGSKDQRTTHRPLYIRADGVGWDLYCHEHQWLIRFRH